MRWFSIGVSGGCMVRADGGVAGWPVDNLREVLEAGSLGLSLESGGFAHGDVCEGMTVCRGCAAAICAICAVCGSSDFRGE